MGSNPSLSTDVLSLALGKSIRRSVHWGSSPPMQNGEWVAGDRLKGDDLTGRFDSDTLNTSLLGIKYWPACVLVIGWRNNNA